MKKKNIAIIGCTGLVGQMILKVFEERNFLVGKLYLLASGKSAGQHLTFKNSDYVVEELTAESLKKEIDIAFFTAGADISKKYAPQAVLNGAIVIDNSSAWRQADDVPLVVPEINSEDLARHNGIIGNPNCSTIQAVLALYPLAKSKGIKRVIFSTYQAVSGAGRKGINDLEEGLKGSDPTMFPHPIANNCIAQIGDFIQIGPYTNYTKEEVKMIFETRKILHIEGLPINATTVRVPVLNGHCISVNVELESPFSINQIYQEWQDQAGLVVIDDPQNHLYPTPLIATGTDAVYVGRLRRDLSVDNGLTFFVVADNIRKGAATNAVQIAELLIKE